MFFMTTRTSSISCVNTCSVTFVCHPIAEKTARRPPASGVHPTRRRTRHKPTANKTNDTTNVSAASMRTGGQSPPDWNPTTKPMTKYTVAMRIDMRKIRRTLRFIVALASPSRLPSLHPQAPRPPARTPLVRSGYGDSPHQWAREVVSSRLPSVPSCGFAHVTLAPRFMGAGDADADAGARVGLALEGERPADESDQRGVGQQPTPRAGGMERGE